MLTESSSGKFGAFTRKQNEFLRRYQVFYESKSLHERYL